MKKTDNSDVHFDYRDPNVILFSDVTHICNARRTTYTEFFMIMLVTHGNCSTTVDSEEIHLEAGDLFVCTPRTIIDSGTTSQDFKSLIFILSPDYAASILQNSSLCMSPRMFHQKTAILHLEDWESTAMSQYYHLLSSIFNMPKGEARENSIPLLLQSFIYTVSELFSARGFGQEKHNRYTQAENIFQRFAHQLKSPSPERTVSEYADLLNITPKYLNTICKKIAGVTASEMIKQETLAKAQAMLKNPNFSIKEIASMLGFANQSHFGTFLRRELGHSPQAIRKGI